MARPRDEHGRFVTKRNPAGHAAQPKAEAKPKPKPAKAADAKAQATGKATKPARAAAAKPKPSGKATRATRPAKPAPARPAKPAPKAARPVETTAHDAPPPQVWTYEVVEAVAEQAHVAWSGWTRWMIDVWSPEAVARWERQIATPYADLSESEKESDRKEARAYLAAIDRASVAPRPQRDAADWIERAQPGSTVVLGGIVGTQDADGSTAVWSR